MPEIVKHKYGCFDFEQFEKYKSIMQKKIFWLILYTDKKTNYQYKNVDVSLYHKNLMEQIAGLNSLLFYPTDIIEILSTLEAALIVLETKEGFDFSKYRKLVLDAGAAMKRLKVGDYNGLL